LFSDQPDVMAGSGWLLDSYWGPDENFVLVNGN